MSRYKTFLILALWVSFLILTLPFYVSEAESQQDQLQLAQGSYEKVSPLDISPKPDVIQDKEFRAGGEVSLDQKQTSESEEKELIPVREIPPLIADKPSKISYQLAVNDRLAIGVWRVRELSLEVIVGPDGKISFPLIGDIVAAGRTLSEIDAEITQKLKVYVEDPQVSVMVKEFAGYRLAVIGEIKKPGVYKFVGRTRIMDIIALAGGFTDRAKQAHIVIVRESDEPDEPDLVDVYIKSVLKGDISKNIEVEPNDIIYVSRSFVSHLKEFYDNWIDPLLGTAVEYETLHSLRKSTRD